MKKSKAQMILAAALMAVTLGGCGEVPYELTESEQNIIVDYAAHVVSKHNVYQKDGLVWVDFAQEEEPETEQPVEQADSEGETEQPAEEGTSSEGTMEAEADSSCQNATLNELFGQQGINVEYTGAYLTDSYVQDTYYALYPDAGKQYLVVQIELQNTAGVDVKVDNLGLVSSFRAVLNGEKEVPSEMTVLLEDFAEFQDVVPADTSKQTVLLFQVPDSVTDIESLDIYVTMSGEKYQIIL